MDSSFHVATANPDGRGSRSVSHSRPSAGAVGASASAALGLQLFLGLVAGTGATGCADGTTDHRTWWASDRATDQGASGATTERTGAGSTFVVTFRSLTGNGTADGADRATDHRARRSTDGHPNGGAAERAGTGADGLAAVLVVIVDVDAAIVRVVRVLDASPFVKQVVLRAWIARFVSSIHPWAPS
jgi:hypothetical protein